MVEKGLKIQDKHKPNTPKGTPNTGKMVAIV